MIWVTRMSRLKTGIVVAMLVWLALVTSLVTAVVWRSPVSRAVLLMGWGLILLWIFLCGSLLFRFRDNIRAFVQRLPYPPGLVFVLFATLLACLEEAITTTMTNLAPLFGVRIGQAYITASTNFFDVIALHSVVAFIPQFAVWAWLLARYKFQPFTVFLLYGITGLFNEISFGGPQQAANFALWMFVYGLMVYLPAYCYAVPASARQPRWWHYPLAIVLPMPSSVCSLIFVKLFAPNHPAIHFPPIKG